MTSRYIERSLEPVLQRAAREFPVVVLTGPRQSGKTTLLKHLFDDYQYLSLEFPDVRAAAASDPRGFLDLYSPPVIFDEVQYAPELFPYIKERVDAHRDQAGQYVLSGSQNLLLAQRISESLAGRAAILRLLPLAQRELDGRPQAHLPWEVDAAEQDRPMLTHAALWQRLLRGGYPELATDPRRDSALWHGSYVQTYLERDVRLIRQVGDLATFQNFLRVLAARSGQLLNMADLSRDLGVALNTIKSWLSVLEATFQIVILRPYFANIGKRLIKSPKVYFTDVGTLCYLVGLRDPQHAAAGPMGGQIFETAVLAEISKTLAHRGETLPLYFWRTAAGEEVDLIVEYQGKLVPLEVKLSATPRRTMAASIERLRADFGQRLARGYVIHPGDVRLPLGTSAESLPFSLL